jgi:hypothetical protein
MPLGWAVVGGDQDKKRSRFSRWSRRRRVVCASLGGVLLVGVPGLWVAIHQVPWLGPALADGARAVLGPGPVAWMEDVAYGVADRLNLARNQDAPPKTYWETPATPAAEDGATVVASTRTGVGAPPPSYEPPFPRVAAEGDGQWVAMADPGAPDAPAAMWKSLVHPDPKRSWAAVAIVAIDLSRIDLHVMAGTVEPYNDKIPRDRRPGIIPTDRQPDLLAVFNGGFKKTHGHYGMMVDGTTFVAPRDVACTVGFYKDGSLRIGTWTQIKDGEAQMRAYRQTPPCLVEDGSTHQALGEEYNRDWGAAVGGETVIRRSAIGIDEGGRTLFYGLGDSVTAKSLARAMQAAGARSAAQLDVNYSYPRFLSYERPSPTEAPKAKTGLIPDLKFTSWEYVGESSPRDFFYLTRSRSDS